MRVSDNTIEHLSAMIERAQALRQVMRAAHMPSSAVGEVALQLRATGHELTVIAGDLEEAQGKAAAFHCTELRACA